MDKRNQRQVIGNDGVRGVVVSEEQRDNTPYVLVEFADGARALFAQAVLEQQSDGSYRVPIGSADLSRFAVPVVDTNRRETVVPVLAETLAVGTRTVERERVRISKTVQQHEEVVDVPLQQEEVTVERVAVNQPVDVAPTARYEGDTLIVPVLEEVLVVEKRLVLREELRITKKQHSISQPQRVMLRREEVQVERHDVTQDSGTDTA